MLVVMIVLFALLLVPVNTLLFRPLLRALDLRVERTLGTRERAEKLAASADEILARYEQAVSDVRDRGRAGAARGAGERPQRDRRAHRAGARRGRARDRARAHARSPPRSPRRARGCAPRPSRSRARPPRACWAG